VYAFLVSETYLVIVYKQISTAESTILSDWCLLWSDNEHY
jgi:hypothetical protein